MKLFASKNTLSHYAGDGWLWRGWLFVCALMLSGVALRAQSSTAKEYQIKAVFLFNFVQFVDWPEAAFADATSPLRIGILGDDPFGQTLDEAIRGETVHGRPLVILRARRLDELAGCQLIFISKSEARRLADLLEPLSGRPVLTVSDVEGFAHRGGIIAFYSEGKKVRFEINPTAAKAGELKISSELLGLGKIAGPDRPGGGG